MKYDKASVMRESWRLRRKGLDASTALQFAWALAKRDIREMAAARPAPQENEKKTANLLRDTRGWLTSCKSQEVQNDCHA
jgi:hypothetical protein